MHCTDENVSYVCIRLLRVGVHIGTGEEVAIKLESVRSKHPQLLYESKVLRYLKGGVGLPEGARLFSGVFLICFLQWPQVDAQGEWQFCGMASRETIMSW